MDGLTLEPHPAHEMIHGVRVQIIRDQYQVMVNGARVGYCATDPSGPIQFIRHYPEAFIEQVVAEVNLRRGGEAEIVSQPPPEPEEPIQEYDEEETEEEPDG